MIIHKIESEEQRQAYLSALERVIAAGHSYDLHTLTELVQGIKDAKCGKETDDGIIWDARNQDWE